MSLRKLVINTFGFSRAESNGFLVLVPLIILILFSQPFFEYWQSKQPKDFSADAKQLDSLLVKWKIEEVAKENLSQKRFEFNPNLVDKQALQTLGFDAKVSARIVNYTSKGGVFRTKKDLLKIYGVDSAHFQKIENLILLPDSFITKEKSKKFSFESTKRQSPAFDLNQADTTILKSIYGIGSKLSQRIIKYRESLGGFISMEQVREVYGLDSVVVNRIKKRAFINQHFKPKKLNINTASEELLDQHPYLNRKEAKAIVTYRFQIKKFDTIAELQNIKSLPSSTFEKIRNYLSVED